MAKFVLEACVEGCPICRAQMAEAEQAVVALDEMAQHHPAWMRERPWRPRTA